MALRVVLDHGAARVAETLVECRRLEAMRAQEHLRTSAVSRLLLDREDQLRAESPVPLLPMHPEVSHVAGAAPGVPRDRGDDLACRILHGSRERAPVHDPRGLRVELV